MPCNVWRIPKNLPGMLWESRCWTTQERNETFPSSTVSGVPRGSLADPAENLPEMGHVISRERALGRAGGKGWEGSGWGRGLGKICFIYLFSSFFFFQNFCLSFLIFQFFFSFFFQIETCSENTLRRQKRRRKRTGRRRERRAGWGRRRLLGAAALVAAAGGGVIRAGLVGLHVGASALHFVEHSANRTVDGVSRSILFVVEIFEHRWR